MSNISIKYTTCESGDWVILEADNDGNFHASGHSISSGDWIDLLNFLGYKVDKEEISDEEMEQRC